MTTQERPSFQIPEIPWPTEITATDIDKVRGYNNQGLSIGASVAETTRRAVREELPFDEALEKQVNTFEEVLTATSINKELQEQQIRHLFKTGTPLDVIDYLTLLESQKWRGMDYENRPVLAAIERSRQRFHDLYNEALKQI